MMIWLKMINPRVISWRETLTQGTDSRHQSAIKSQISVNYNHLEPVAAFSCLGRTVAYNNRGWLALYQNLWNAQRRLAMVGEVVSKTGSTVQDRGVLCKSVVQLVLLYGSESWVVTGEMLKVLEAFIIG